MEPLADRQLVALRIELEKACAKEVARRWEDTTKMLEANRAENAKAICLWIKARRPDSPLALLIASEIEAEYCAALSLKTLVDELERRFLNEVVPPTDRIVDPLIEKVKKALNQE